MAGSKDTWRLAAAGALVAALLLATTSPAHAGTTSITDGDGVEYDAACLTNDGSTVAPPAPNNIPTPGGAGGSLQGGDGCDGTSNYDGSTEATDLLSVELSTNGVVHGPSNTQLVAKFTIDGSVPAAGCAACTMDLPDAAFTGATYRALFQNQQQQTNAPTNPAGGGCARVPTGTVDDVHGAWQDGFHLFVGYEVAFDGTKWVHRALVGTYDPGPGGGYVATELGVRPAGFWTSTDPNAVFGTHWNTTIVSGANTVITVTVDGLLGAASPLCATGVFHTVYAKAGDAIVNAKGLSTAISLPPRPFVGGYSHVPRAGAVEYFSDITAGNSGNFGIVGTTMQPNRTGVSYTSGLNPASSDTQGPGPSCPPVGPTHQACHQDDDNIGERGTYNPEWWDTVYGFTA